MFLNQRDTAVWLQCFCQLSRNLRFLKPLRLLLDMDDWEGYGGFNDYFLLHSLYPRR